MSSLADRVYWRVLVIRCQAGDRSAIEELVARCQPRLRAFLYKMLPRHQSADDLAQEVWLDVFRDLGRLADPGAFLPWFYRIARHRAFRILRGRQQTVGSLDDVEGAEPSDDHGDFTPADAQAVHAALDQLGPEHREVLLLRFMEDMSYDDIAAVVGCQLGTVRSRIHNAKRALRRIIENGEQT